jgi:histidyl-tRNA synthetase
LLGTEVFSEEQRARIELNPLRAFDWEGEEIRRVTEDAPKMIDALGDADREHFEQVRRLLDHAGIEYTIDPRLVRGLDYYTRTVFEFRCDALVAQSGIGGGGRYDRLIEQIGGEPTPAAGWATGLERIAQAMASTGRALEAVSADDRAGKTSSRPMVVFALAEESARERAFAIISHLRRKGVGATMDLGGRTLKGQMKQAGRLAAPWVVIIGGDEWSRGVAAVRDMRAQEQEELELAALEDELLRRVDSG